MFCQSLGLTGASDQDTIRIYRDYSTLRTDGNDHPVLRVCAGLKAPPDIQIGFPALPEVGSPVYFELLREWLRVCDEDHAQYGCPPDSDSPLPTRVLDVGVDNDLNSLHLYCANHDERGEYIALSHCWGKLPPEIREKICTYLRNIDDRRKGINFNMLPKTFQDAVVVTRKLGKRFLWIDSLCIIQDDKQDWEKESKLMEQVFSSAYCTIAATSAGDSTEGFLHSNHSPSSTQFVSVPYTLKSPLYVCQAIDDFGRDVLEGKLNQRAWVLQERALSHRTIHITKTQTYWECGRGVHCETLTRMNK